MFRDEKLIKKKSDKLTVKWKVVLTFGLTKKDSEHFP